MKSFSSSDSTNSIGNTIIVADGNYAMFDFIEDLLGCEDLKIVRAMTGAEGLSILGKNSIDLALIDLNLPDMSGVSFLRRMKSISPRTKGIIITANADVESYVNSMNKGAFDYLIRPFPSYRLLNVVEQALHTH